MDEFVSKKLLVAKFNELASKYIDGDKRQRGLAYTTAADMIALADAADVQPVKRGSWIAENRDNRGYADCYTCTNCNCYTYTYTLMKDCEYDYCPRCGARMDGDNNA